MKRRLLNTMWVIVLLLVCNYSYEQPTILPREQVYLHTDRSEYASGEDVYYSVYLRNPSVNDTILSEVLYVELIDQGTNKIAFQQVKVTDGRASGTISIPYELESQSIIIRAYTNYMRNFDAGRFFRQALLVHGTAEKSVIDRKDEPISLSAYPEGGSLIVDIPSVVGIKLESASKGIKGQVELLKNGFVQKTIETNEYGFAKLLLKPESNTTYALRHDGVSYEIPTALSSGIGIMTRTTEDFINVKVDYRSINKLSDYSLMAISNSDILFYETLDNKLYKFDKSALPVGCITLAIIDSQNKPVAERLAFNHYGIDDVFFDAELPSRASQPHSKVSIPIELYDLEGSGITSSLSVSVVDNRFQSEQEDITSSLLLNQEIKGHIEDAEQYLSSNEQEVIERTELLLLTQGWRNYHWTQPNEINYIKEQDLTIRGRTVKKKNMNEGVKAFGTLSVLQDPFMLLPIETDELGYFELTDVKLSGIFPLFFQLGTKRLDLGEEKVGEARGNKKIEVLMEKPAQHDVSHVDTPISISIEDFEAGDLYVPKESAPEDDWYVDESLLLSEITITEREIDKWVDYYEDATEYSTPDTRLYTDNGMAVESYANIYGILRGKVPGLEFTTGDRIVIRGRSSGLSPGTVANNYAKFMLNGSFVSKETVLSIQPMDIAYVDVLRSASKLSIYGELGVGGIIAIYLKPPGSRSRANIKPKEKKTKGIYKDYMGYSVAKEFYKPDYAVYGIFDTDKLRRTVYWEPIIETDEDGEAKIEFYTSDYLGTYHINIQGLTKEGAPVSYQTSFVVDDGL